MGLAKKNQVDAFDAFSAAEAPDATKQAQIPLPPMTPYNHGIIVNCSEAISQKVATKMSEELLKTKGAIVLDFKRKCSINLPVLKTLAQMAKTHMENQRDVYILYPDDELLKMVNGQGLGQLLQIATRKGMIPGLQDDQVPKLDLKFINSFIDCTVETLKTQCNVELKSGKPFLSNTQPAVKGDIVGLITIKSDSFNGVIAISLPEQVFLFAMGQMVGDVFTEINDEIASGATELLNIIYGNARNTLNQMGYKLQRVIPSVIRGAGISLTHLTSSPTLMIPFETAKGIFYIEIGLAEVHQE